MVWWYLSSGVTTYPANRRHSPDAVSMIGNVFDASPTLKQHWVNAALARSVVPYKPKGSMHCLLYKINYFLALEQSSAKSNMATVRTDFYSEGSCSVIIAFSHPCELKSWMIRPIITVQYFGITLPLETSFAIFFIIINFCGSKQNRSALIKIILVGLLAVPTVHKVNLMKIQFRYHSHRFDNK